MSVVAKKRARALSLAGLGLSAAMILGACAGGSTDAGSSSGEETTEAASSNVIAEHYFSGDLGAQAFAEIWPLCEQQAGITMDNPTIDHEAFKDAILVQLAGGNAPDLFSYWAGARTQSLIDNGQLDPIDDMWAAAELDAAIPASIADSAATYGGSKYLVPFVYHYAGMFYNPAVLETAGITEIPTDWDGLMAMAATLKAQGITPFALGSTNRWPAQFWFDYLILRTAGPEYRAALMSGEASYDDPEVVAALELWKEAIDAGYFNTAPNGSDWTDAADQVSRGEAAMTLMGTWITGYWDGNGLVAGTDYDFFPFPEVTPGVALASVGPVDGWVMPAEAKNQEGAKKVLECLASPEAQKVMALLQGAIAANSNTDLSEQNSVMQKAAQQVANSEAFVFNYDLATPPAVAEVGLNMFVEFLDNPADIAGILGKTATEAAAAF